MVIWSSAQLQKLLRRGFKYLIAMCERRRRRGSRLGLWLTARRRMWRGTFCEGNCPSRAVAEELLN